MAARLAQPAPRVFLGAATLAAGHGGIARVARMSARALIEAGYEADLASYLDQPPFSFHGHEVATSRASKLAFAARVHLAAPTHSHFLYDSAGIARAHPRLPGLRRPYAVWMHGIEAWEGLRPAAARALAGADIVLVNSQFTLDRYRTLHGALNSAKVCWLATEDDEPPVLPADFAGPPAVLIMSRIDATEGYKGHDALIECWPEVSSAVPGARLLIAGGGSGLDGLRGAVKASSAAGSIEVAGFVPEADTPTLWQRAHLFAMPSRGEGFGLVYAEAMRQGLPVIASVHDAGQEVNVDGVTGYNVDLGRKGELSSRLIALLRDPGLARKMGQAGHRRWHDHFRFSAFERRLGPIIRAFMGDAS